MRVDLGFRANDKVIQLLTDIALTKSHWVDPGC